MRHNDHFENILVNSFLLIYFLIYSVSISQYCLYNQLSFFKTNNIAHVIAPINNNNGKKKSFSSPVFVSHINNATDDIKNKHANIIYATFFLCS